MGGIEGGAELVARLALPSFDEVRGLGEAAGGGIGRRREVATLRKKPTRGTKMSAVSLLLRGGGVTY